MMNTQIDQPDQQKNSQQQRSERTVIAIGLIGVGLLFLMARVVDLGWLVLPILAGLFALAGMLRRDAGWFIPAGILGGLSLGIALLDSSLVAVNEAVEGGVFLVAFGAGWLSITLLSAIFARRRLLWPLIPAVVLSAIGAAVLVGDRGERALEQVFLVLSYAWPLALVAAGAYLLLHARQQG